MPEYEWSLCPACGGEFGPDRTCMTCGEPNVVEGLGEDPKAPAPEPAHGVTPEDWRERSRARTEAERAGSVKEGFLFLLGMHSLQLLWLFSEAEMIWFTGITQLPYAFILFLLFAFQSRWKSLGGLFLGVGVTIVINFALVSVYCGAHGVH